MGNLASLVERVRGRLDQYVNNRPQLATFTAENADGSFTVSPIQGYGTLGGSSIVEVGRELIQVANYDPTTGLCTVPPWGRGMLGTTVVSHAVNDKVTFNPLWPFWHVAQHIIDGINVIYPDVFAVKNATLTTSVSAERYELPSDCDEILDIRIEWFGTSAPQRRIGRYSVDSSNADGKRYLHIPLPPVSGRPIRLSYRAAPTLPTSPDDTSWTWASSGLPAGAEDLPVLYAASSLILTVETARLQNYASEQSDRSRFIQAGSASAVSRRLEEVFDRRLKEEQRKLRQLYPMKLFREFNG